ncbi:MAG: hypothetical protein M1827_001237 [Pycnora praestabilis]|nr:MAG: hypothetical protein M1827_001237 [Pycnora praestabilis]
MQYVRSIGGSVSKTWNSINPATLSGAIDVIVVEQQDGSLACSPFHVRFGKFSLLRPYEKKVEFRVNNVKQDHAMKLGEGGEAFFVFETSEDIPAGLQTSPLISPAASPQNIPAEEGTPSSLQEPDFLDLTTENKKARSGSNGMREAGLPILSPERRARSEIGALSTLSRSHEEPSNRTTPRDWSSIRALQSALLQRSTSDDILPSAAQTLLNSFSEEQLEQAQSHLRLQPSTPPPGLNTQPPTDYSNSPPPLPINEAVNRAISLSKKLSVSNIPTQVTESGDLMLDMTGYKSSEDEALRAEVIARKILAEELEGNYDIGALIGADEHGNLWIYSSEEAKEAAGLKAGLRGLAPGAMLSSDAASDPGYQSDGERSTSTTDLVGVHESRESDSAISGLVTPPKTPPESTTAGDLNRTYAKTLRLTSDQLRELGLKPGANSMSFSVNRATCQAHMYYWKYDVPIVISDIDGTITKSDALGHVLNMIGRDWTHIGVAKLYTDIVANGYHIMYLTSRSVGQADTTRAYLNGVNQEGYRLPKGPVIMSPDRTIAALRREIYLRKPEVFKMACLRDILNLFSHKHNPFYAGFGNRLTDALSYRTVNIPSTRIFTINSNAEVSLDLLSLNKYKSSYVTMREVVDHFFPPVGLLITGGGEEFTDFNYWRDAPLEVEDFSASESEGNGEDDIEDQSLRSEDEGSDGADYDEPTDELGDSYISRDSIDDGDDIGESIVESIVDEDVLERSIVEGERGNVDKPAELSEHGAVATVSEILRTPRQAEIIIEGDDEDFDAQKLDSIGAANSLPGNLVSNLRSTESSPVNP